MTTPQTITIDDVQHVRADSIKQTDGDIKIVVLDRGFVFVGHTKLEDDFVVLMKARNIRVWGTTKGLGELVSGPLSNTKLDYAGSVKIPLRALIFMIDVEQGKWKLS